MRTKQEVNLICVNCEVSYNVAEKYKVFECRTMANKKHHFIQFSRWVQLKKDLGKI